MSFDATKAAQSRVVLLGGEEEALRRRALTAMMEVATADGDFDLQTFESDEGHPGDWLASAGTAPFLSAKRTVIVRHLLRKDIFSSRSKGEDDAPAGAESKALIETLVKSFKALPETALLILVADDESGDENRQRRLASIRKGWEKLVKDGGGLVADFKTDAKQIRESIKREADRLGKKISDASAESLAEMTGGNFSRGVEELEKLALYVGTEPQIREADIRAVVVPSREWNVYKLIDAIVDGSVPEALRQLRILVGSQTKAEEAAFSRILPTMSRQLRLLWQARICIEAKVNPANAPESVSRLFLDKASIAKEPPYRHGRLAQQARRMDFKTLTTCLEAVSDADAKLKGLESAFSPIETLESMVLTMIQVMAPRAAVR